MIDINDLRALVVLIACVRFYREEKRPPIQKDLLLRVPSKRNDEGERVEFGYGVGAVVQVWNSLDRIGEEYPFQLHNMPQLAHALKLLRRHKLMQEPTRLYGRARKGKAYIPTAKGKALVDALPEDWREWKPLSEYTGVTVR